MNSAFNAMISGLPLSGYAEVLTEVRELCYRKIRNYGTSRNVAGSIPDQVVVFFNWHNPSSFIIALAPIEFLT
jgi:hypothetical protein